MPRITRTRLALLLGLSLFVPEAGRAGENARFENGRIAMEFDASRGAVVSLAEPGSGREWINANRTLVPLWELMRADGKPAIEPGGAADFAISREADGALRFDWSDFGLEEAPGLRVIATAKLGQGGDEGTVDWRLKIEGIAGVGLDQVRYPRLGPLASQEGETLAVPQWLGESTRQIRALLNPKGGGPGRSREWAYPGLLSMQFLSWSAGDGKGLWLATEDPDARHKRLAVRGDGQGGLRLEAIHLPARDRDDPGIYELPYPARVGLSDGGWFGASRAYGRWARDQEWAQNSRLKRGLVPEWMRNTGLWVWNRGKSPGVLKPAAALQKRLGNDVPVSVFWHWWHGCAYDQGFPDYLPPREGTEAFRDAVATALEQGLHSIVYMNQRLWGMTAPSWEAEGASRFAVKGPDGAIHPEVYNTFTKSPCASMCMGTPFWRGKYAGLAAEALNDLGVDGIYMDQACSSLECYDPTHPHPPGGGTYWMEGFRALEADLRARANRPVGLAGEGCGESWLPHLDLMLALQVSMERYASPGEWEPIPMFHAVYHDLGLTFGNYASLTRPPYDELWPAEKAPADRLKLLDREFQRQFRLEQARSLCWGQQLTLANVTEEVLSERIEELEFLATLVRLRKDLLPFLRDGRMLPPVEVAGVPPVTIPMSRLSIYAGQQGAVQEFEKTVVPLLANAWRAPDGRIAVVAVNIDDREIKATLHLPPEAQGRPIEATLPPASARSWILDP